MDAIARMEVLLIVWLTLVGACVGSFLNVCIFRLPRRCLSVLRPLRSFCPGCRRQLTWSENVPIVSWVLQRGRCRGCGGAISARYPLIEALTAGIFLWLALRTLQGHMDDPGRWALFVVHAALASALLVCTVTDIDFRIIPDEIDVPGIILAPLIVLALPAAFAPAAPPVAQAAGWLAGHLDPAFAWWGIEGLLRPLEALAALPRTAPGAYAHVAAFGGAVLGAAVGAGFIYGTGVVFTRLLDRDAMGFGDVKYMGMIGGFAGWQGVVVTMMVACLAGSIGGLVHMAASGRPYILGRDLDDEDLTPLRRLALAITGARGPAAPDERLSIRPGTGLLARFATGDPYIPFGPFLTLGAFVAIFFPDALFRLLAP
ncbi:MAG: prepilin peptidase [Planctomycetes bacterium]|nr:prepilin peptidase [Planctomycetota bacterium]